MNVRCQQNVTFIIAIAAYGVEDEQYPSHYHISSLPKIIKYLQLQKFGNDL